MTQKQLAIKACKCLVQKQIEHGSDGFSFVTDADYCTDIKWEDVLCTLTELERSERKTGMWITKDVVKILASGECLDGFCQCELCGDVFPYQYSSYNYCPNCGSYNGGRAG